jgi:glutathione S-transferase
MRTRHRGTGRRLEASTGCPGSRADRASMADYTLYLGNKNYSSWSLRAWLVMKQCGVAFDEEVVPLREADTRNAIRRHSPTGKLPALKSGELVVCESIAIAEFLAERFPEAKLWPADRAARAAARAASAEMHAGFMELRKAVPMNCRHPVKPKSLTEAVQADIDRMTSDRLPRPLRSRRAAAAGE